MTVSVQCLCLKWTDCCTVGAISLWDCWRTRSCWSVMIQLGGNDVAPKNIYLKCDVFFFCFAAFSSFCAQWNYMDIATELNVLHIFLIKHILIVFQGEMLFTCLLAFAKKTTLLFKVVFPSRSHIYCLLASLWAAIPKTSATGSAVVGTCAATMQHLLHAERRAVSSKCCRWV